MKDRLDYIKYTLKNGLTLVYLPMDVEFNTIDYTLPFGHLNNTGQFPGGTFHFLEHMCFHRSKLYPKKDSFEKFLASIGSKINAATSNNFTKYYLSVPSQEIEPALTGLLSHIFNPIIDENDINIERGIIKNERRSHLLFSYFSISFLPGKKAPNLLRSFFIIALSILISFSSIIGLNICESKPVSAGSISWLG